MNLSTEEMALVKEAQASLAKAKHEIRDAIAACRKLAKVNRDAGRLAESNAAMRLEGELHCALGGLMAAHADASDALVNGFDDGGEVVVFGGGGR